MKRTLRRAAITSFVAGLLMCAPAVHADPLLVTGGAVTLSWDGFSSFTLTGANFFFGGSLLTSPDLTLTAPVGATVDLSRGVSLSSRAGYPASAIINGVTYSSITTQGMLSLSAVPFAVTTEADGISFTTPFTMTGTILGFSGVQTVSPLFDVTLAGSGMAFIGPLRDTGGGQYILNAGGIIYSFKPVKPVPEPATLLLLFTGLAGFAVRRRHRNTMLRRHRDPTPLTPALTRLTDDRRSRG